MTPRESLEAAGWIRTPLYQGRWTDPVTKISCSEAAAILTQLARDEAKETSDDVPHESDTNPNSTVAVVADKAAYSEIQSAPVATSVSAPDLAQKFHEAYERLAPQFGYETRKASAKPWAEVPENNRNLMTAVCEEILKYASSSSAALLAANEVIRRQLKKVCDQAEAAPEYWQRIFADMAAGRASDIEQFTVRAEAAEAKVIHWKLMADNLRDSRDRLQESLRAAANHLHYVGQEQAAGQARAALDPVPDTE